MAASQYTQFNIHYYKGGYKEQYPTMTNEEFYTMIKKIIHEVIDESDDIAFYAYIMHDKDRDYSVEGDPLKPAHVHLTILLKSGVKKTIGAIATRFKTTQESNVERCKDFFNQMQYLEHRTDNALFERKHIYDHSQVHYEILAERTVDNRPIRTIHDCYISMEKKSRKKRDKEAAKEKKNDIFTALLEKIRVGKLSKTEALKALEETDEIDITPYDLMDFNSLADSAVELYFIKKVDELKEKGRNLTTILISCDDLDSTGSGKTKIATILLKELYGTNFFKGTSPDKKKTPDLLQGYKGEKGLLIDEFRGGEFNVDAFKNSFDPQNFAPVSSRNKNVVFIGETICFTSSYSISEIVYKTMRYSEGGSNYFTTNLKLREPHFDDYTEEYFKDALQLCRRIPIYVYLQKKDGNLTINIYRWDNRKEDYYLNRGYGLAIKKTLKNYDPDNEKHITAIAKLIYKEMKNPTQIKDIIPMEKINKFEEVEEYQDNLNYEIAYKRFWDNFDIETVGKEEVISDELLEEV